MPQGSDLTGEAGPKGPRLWRSAYELRLLIGSSKDILN